MIMKGPEDPLALGEKFCLPSHLRLQDHSLSVCACTCVPTGGGWSPVRTSTANAEI